MKLRDFLADRVPYIAVYLFNIALVVLVIELDLLLRDVSLNAGNLTYIAVLSIAGVALYLVIDYIRQRSFYRELNDLNGRQEMDDVLHLQSAVTREQQALQRLVHDNYRRYADRLTQYRQQQEQHRHFVQQWVHQMKTPVSVIQLLTQQSVAGGNGAESDPLKLARSIEEENERIKHGLDMMLYAARLDRFEMDLQPRRIDLVPLLRQTINDHKKACVRYGIYPKLTAPAEGCRVETDEKWMAFVFHQIITNAIKYSRQKEGAKALNVTIAKDAAVTRVSVRDEGIGIAEQDLPRVFDPFFTGENGRLVAESTGMGLYLAKQVCLQLGHRIMVESQLGEGTTVTVEFQEPDTIHRAVAGPDTE